MDESAQSGASDNNVDGERGWRAQDYPIYPPLPPV